MKWFFAMNQDSVNFAGYSEMAKVAVISAAENAPELTANMLFDGDLEHELVIWMKEHGVTVWPIRSKFYDGIKELSARMGAGYLNIGAGAFLRMEIPKLCADEKWIDEFVFYTDVDVMFLSSTTPYLENLRPKYFACVPETNHEDPTDMNTGVMLMNVKGMQRVDEKITAFGRKNLESMLLNAFDQGLCRNYFLPLNRFLINLNILPPFYQYWSYKKIWGRIWVRIRPLNKPQWEKLPPILNWKSYDGENSGAVIVHFHGPKPNEDATNVSPVLATMRNEGFRYYCLEWNKYRAKV